MTIGPWVYRFRWLVLAGWLAGAVLLGVVSSQLGPATSEPTSFLPAGSDYSRAVQALQECFPGSTGLSEAVVVFERPSGPLTKADHHAIESVAAAIGKPGPHAMGADLQGVTVLSPASIRLPANPLKSPDRRAALLIANVPATFITIRSYRVVEHVRAVARAAELPAGLAVAVTGSSGFGHDYALATRRSDERTRYVTLVAVIVILLLVYRAPLAAMVPLIAISAGAFVAMNVLAIAQHFGMHVGTGERIFTFVLLYGAGTDYSLLFISRYRELLDGSQPPPEALSNGLSDTFPPILASAATDTVGLLMLCFAQYGVFRTAGPAIAIGLIIALLAAMTVVPALVALCGRAMFWPGGRMGQIGSRRLWPAVARLVTARPGVVLAVAAVLLGIPAAQTLRVRWVYDALAELEPSRPDGVGNAAAGLQQARRHWPVGQIAPVTVLIRNDKPLTGEQWGDLSRRVTSRLMALEGVRDVRSLTQPVGRRVDLFSEALLVAAAPRIRPMYLSAQAPAMRVAAVLDQPALTLEAMADAERIRQAVTNAANQANLHAEVHLAGATAEMMSIRTVTHGDFHRVAVLVLSVIFVVVLVLLRDWLLAVFLVGVTFLGYLATVGLSSWVFAALGGGGLDWKVEVFLFVMMTAVGVDYSIFLAARLAQEAAAAPVAEATRQAVIHTGPVISSCGVIMAATLGSLMAGELKLLHQLGFALALGMLLDTFLVRPLLLPSFVALTGRTGRIGRRRGL